MLNFDVQFHGGYTNKEIKVIKIEKDGRNILKMIITEKNNLLLFNQESNNGPISSLPELDK